MGTPWGSNGLGREVIDQETGRKKLTENQEKFLDWLLGERPVVNGRPQQQQEFAAEIGVKPMDLANWKRDKWFVLEWQSRLNVELLHPDTFGSIMKAIAAKAKSGDVKAADLYLRYVDKVSPKVAVAEEIDWENVPEDELEEMFKRSV